MMTKQEVSAEYKLTDHGTVASPGKFEGEMWYAVALWDLVLNGGADFETGEDPTVAWFHVDAGLTMDLAEDEREIFAQSYPPGSYLGVYENSQGFVFLTSSATDPDCDCDDGCEACTQKEGEV